MEIMVEKNILITGHLGYVGASLIKHLKFNHPNYTLIGFDTGFFARETTLIDDNLPEKFLDKVYSGDIRNIPEHILENIDTVIHLAAISNDPISNQFEDITYNINYHSTVQLAIKAKKLKVKNFIFASSCSVYGFAENREVNEDSELNPLTPYAKSKLGAEFTLGQLASNNFKVTCLRFATACGMSDRLRLDLVLNDFVTSAYLNKKIEILSDGSPWRPLINTVDMSRAISWAINREGEEFEIVNAGSNDWNFQVKDLAELVKEQLPETKISINKNASPDKRSYKVNFDKFKKLAPYHQPQITIQETILGLIEGLKKIKFKDKNFRNGNLIRLNKINYLKHINLIGDNLKWKI
jgi:nucleoside-diphosphate-sugar epimerase